MEHGQKACAIDSGQPGNILDNGSYSWTCLVPDIHRNYTASDAAGGNIIQPEHGRIKRNIIVSRIEVGYATDVDTSRKVAARERTRRSIDGDGNFAGGSGRR